MSRDDFSKSTIRNLRERVSGICSKPGCRVRTTGAHSTEKQKVLNVGKASHICAASKGGPRYDENMTPQQRKSIDNAIWLCGIHADEIDKDDEEKYSEKTLKEWKVQAEENSRHEIGKPLPHNDDAINTVTTALTGMAKKPLLAAISNTHKGTENALEELDPRFAVKSSYQDNITAYTIYPKDENVSLNFTINPVYRDEFIDKYQKLREFGVDLEMNADALSIEGSRLFEELFCSLNDGKFSFSVPKMKAVHKLWLQNPKTGQVEVLEDIQGVIAPASNAFSFSGKCCDDVLGFSYQKSINLKHKKDNITFSLNTDVWDGTDIRTLPYFDKLFSLCSKILDGWKVYTSLEINGSTVFSSKGDDLSDAKTFISWNNFFYYIKRCKIVTKYLNKQIYFNKRFDFSAEEHRQIADAADIVEGKYLLKLDVNPTGKMIITDETLDLFVNLGEDGGSLKFSINNQEELVILGVKVLLPPKIIYMSHVLPKFKESISSLKGGDEIFVELVPQKNHNALVVYDESLLPA